MSAAPVKNPLSNFDAQVYKDVEELLKKVINEEPNMEKFKHLGQTEVIPLLDKVAEKAKEKLVEHYSTTEGMKENWLVVCSPLLFSKGALSPSKAHYGIFEIESCGVDFMVMNS